MGKLVLGMIMACVATVANAGALTVTSYDMPNGDGTASGGSYNYWDAGYTGAGNAHLDGAMLSGGLGKLTDGFSSTQLWYSVSNSAGTGDYVGWVKPTTSNPVLTFHFAGVTKLSGVSIQLDNSGVGGVFAPNAILVDGVAQSFTAPALGTVGVVTLTGLSSIGATHTIEFDQPSTSTWTFVSEIGFSGAAVPEPAMWAFLVVGFGLVGLAKRRREVSTPVGFQAGVAE